MTAFELIEILSEVDPESRVTFLAGGYDAQVAEEIVAVATSDCVWVKHGKPDKNEGEADIHHPGKQVTSSDAGRASTESEAVSIVILSTDEDFLFKAAVRRLMLGWTP